MSRIQELVNQLQLQPHPEGGFYAETYRSSTLVPTPAGPRPAATMIYFLLTAGNFSAFHRIASDEGWHHYEGASIYIHVLHEKEGYTCMQLGKSKNDMPQALVPAGAWFASEVAGPEGYALVGCTVAPGFDFADFELAEKNDLASQYSDWKDLVNRLTR